MNKAARQERLARKDPGKIREARLKYLRDEKRIKAVTVCFTDLEGRLHMLDYDKKRLLGSDDNLTFDGSSIKGFSRQAESDLRLGIDWSSFCWLPADVFGPGKVLVFGEVQDQDGSPYVGDVRARLKALSDALNKKGMVAHVSTRSRGSSSTGATPSGGTGSSGPSSSSRPAVTTTRCRATRSASSSTATRRSSAPSGSATKRTTPRSRGRARMNYSHTEAVLAADQVQLYKLVARQVAAQMDLTASFLPKPVAGVNGNGMHTNMSLAKNGKNLFHDKKGQDGLSRLAWDFIQRILANGNDICLVLNSSVNSYRRLDPHFEAPNQIKVSASDRGSMIRIPIGNERSARIEVRSIAPDANPYLAIYTLVRTGLEGPLGGDENDGKRQRTRFLPDNIYDAIRMFKTSKFAQQVLGADVHEKFSELKLASAERCPKALGTRIKRSEIQFHHEVTNQYLWSQF